ncbi:type II toxin-antitoxin system HicA family toxin [uncultured Lactobacillus sp.]|uniref:type II toxin-antitoxin system HicA family toxin n=1 Tax=uncultured Lactobacillus sp. TaxID=153152 RepID=UPI00342950FD
MYSDFELSNKGKTSGSRVQFSYNNVNIDLHKPHPQKYLKRYQLERIKQVLQKVGKL